MRMENWIILAVGKFVGVLSGVWKSYRSLSAQKTFGLVSDGRSLVGTVAVFVV